MADRDDALNVPRETAEFLHALVLAGGFRRGLEIGTSYGYSGLWIGAALRHNGGVLTTVDNNPRKAAAAREVFARTGLSDVIAVLEGDAIDALRQVDGPLDFVFLDADKESCQRYVESLWPKLAHCATLVTDNVTSHADRLAGFVEYLRGHPQLASTLVGIGSGLELTVKLDLQRQTATHDGAEWVI